MIFSCKMFLQACRKTDFMSCISEVKGEEGWEGVRVYKGQEVK